MIIDKLERWERHLKGKAWREAFAYLQGLTGDASEGTFEIRGQDVFARVMSYRTVPVDEARIEAHREYIDIQVALVNDERIDWFPREDLVAIDEYDAAKDVIHFRHPGAALASAVMRPGQFIVLFPEDAHMPKLIADKSHVMKKAVVKVRVSVT